CQREYHCSGPRKHVDFLYRLTSDSFGVRQPEANSIGGKPMVTTIMTAQPYKRHRLRKVVLTLLVLAAIGAGLYWRPTKLGVMTRAYTAWKIGLGNREVKLGSYRIHYMVTG